MRTNPATAQADAPRLGAVLSVREASRRLGVGPYRVRDLMARGDLQGVPQHVGGHIRLQVSLASLEAYQRQQDQQGQQDGGAARAA